MRNVSARRFGAHEGKSGRYAGSLHVPTKQWFNFFSELNYLNIYLGSRLLPHGPEELAMLQIIMHLQNILEHEIEQLIKSPANQHPTKRDKKFLARLIGGYVSFKEKYNRLLGKKLIDQRDWQVMEAIRAIRNVQVHSRPRPSRTKLRYRGHALLTRKTLQAIFFDVDALVQKLRRLSKNKEHWTVIPPGYAAEMGWHMK